MVVLGLLVFSVEAAYQIYGDPTATNWQIVWQANHSLALAVLFYEGGDKLVREYQKKKVQYIYYFTRALVWYMTYDIINEFSFWGKTLQFYNDAMFIKEHIHTNVTMVLVSAALVGIVQAIKPYLNKYLP